MSTTTVVFLVLLGLIALALFLIAARLMGVAVVLYKMDRRLRYATMGLSRNWPSYETYNNPMEAGVAADFEHEKERVARRLAIAP